ncbi:uncharacterized protein LOC129747762 [Uranotaenia lowii]|uniref:uncharacterized protein LOC129747762 n=1 Tax=Uranotaenia lowii TaxID=190385 RepID=UPI002479FEE6|nr:uncharacterized protein LOC129747762 [Uranotaenia lowii]
MYQDCVRLCHDDPNLEDVSFGSYLEDIPEEDESESHSETTSANTVLRQPQRLPLIPSEEELLEDQYFPGLLDDFVQGQASFSGEIFVPEGDSTVVRTTSLLEAFDRRVQHEQSQIRNRLGIGNWAENSGSENYQSGPIEEQVPIREPEIRAAVMGVNIDRTLRNRPETELTRAIDCLTKAEVMQQYQLRADVMNHFSQRIAGQQSSIGGSLQDFSRLSRSKEDENEEENPLEIVSYIGYTRNKK